MNENEGEAEKVREDDSKDCQVKGGAKGKSCKGYLYYTSALKSKSHNPRCIGIPRTFDQVPNYVVAQSEVEATKEGRKLADFYYGCLGYSVFVTGRDSSTDKQGAKTDLPLCVGLELLVDRKVAAADTSAPAPAPTPSSPSHIHNKEDAGRQLPQPPRPHRPPQSTGDDFLNRFTRNANLVASGVAKNMKRVGNYVKDSIDDILYPYRRRPK